MSASDASIKESVTTRFLSTARSLLGSGESLTSAGWVPWKAMCPFSSLATISVVDSTVYSSKSEMAVTTSPASPAIATPKLKNDK
jgi:hypothetical protein